MTSVAVRILVFVILIDLFYMSIGQFYLTQSEDHPPPELEITVETDVDTLIVMGETLVAGKGGCLLCHKITDQGNNRGPDLRGVGGRAATRKPGMSAEAYLTESLVDPGAYVVVEFATAGGDSIMPAADRPPADLSPTEFKALLAFLQSLGGEVTVEITGEDVAAAAARKEKPPEPVPTHPGFALLTVKGCVACHDVLADTRRIGPPLTKVGERLSAAEIRQSIVDPNAVIAEGFQKDLMLANFADTLSAEELDQLVGYLSGEIGLAERLAHPAVHLLVLIVLFNVGITWAMRRASAVARAEPAAGPQTGLALPNPLAWSRWGGIVVGIPIAGALYLWEVAESPEPLAVTSAAALVDSSSELPTAPAPLEAVAETALPGEALFKVTCPVCHGADAKGVPGLGKDMTTSAFIKSQSDAEMVEFIRRGRLADDPLNTTGVAMPPKGANVALTDAEIQLIVEYIRSLSHCVPEGSVVEESIGTESPVQASGRWILPGSILVWLGVWAALRFGVQPPIPGSVMNLYMSIVTISILVFVVADQARARAFLAPVTALLRERRLLLPRIGVLIALPLLLGWITYTQVRPQFDPPFEARTIHPEPPAKFKLHGKDFDVLSARRPPEMELNDENLAAGRSLYYRNCMYCHGDFLNGQGHFADALNPLPANFRDGGTISQLEEGYVYWRIATGGPGLPQGATPWNSSMPVWQDFLSEEEIWQVVGFIYEASGSTPRTWEH